MTAHMTRTPPDPTTIPLAQGYRLGGIVGRLRSEPNRRDLGAIVSTPAAVAAGVFTQNLVCAAPVRVSRQRVPANSIRGIVTCSGNANACTGEQGLADARRMSAILAAELGCREEEVLVASTGIIGRPLPMGIIEPGLKAATAAAAATPAGLSDFAHSILTTDTVIKLRGRELTLGGQSVRLTGIAKGAAMIGPNMATMLGFVLTDARVLPADLQTALSSAVASSFNCISVEGHMSTNDTVFALANGASGGATLTGTDLARFAEALAEVCGELAVAIIEDAEGATHVLELRVSGMRSVSEARQIAKTIAESALVKTAMFGADPNWGRIVSAAGYAGVPFAEEDLSLTLCGTKLYERGRPLPFDAAAVSAAIKSQRRIVAELEFTLGLADGRFWTCDLSEEYIRLNADYTT